MSFPSLLSWRTSLDSCPLPFPPPFYERRKCLESFTLIIGSRFRIKCKEYGNALFNELHCWINDFSQQCSLISKFEELWSNMILMFLREILLMQVNLIERILFQSLRWSYINILIFWIKKGITIFLIQHRFQISILYTFVYTRSKLPLKGSSSSSFFPPFPQTLEN